MTDHTCTKHQPGSRSCAVNHACRCRPCRTADNRYLKQYKHEVATGRHRTTDGIGTRRRIQALIANGWSCAALALQHGVSSRRIQALAHQTGPLTQTTAQGIQNLYDRLWDQPPPATTRAQQQAADRARKHAQELGWAVPLAWDDDEIDDPDAQPSKPRPAMGRHRTTDLIEAAEHGAPLADLTRRFDVKPDSIYRTLHRAQRLDLWDQISPRMDNRQETRAAA